MRGIARRTAELLLMELTQSRNGVSASSRAGNVVLFFVCQRSTQQVFVSATSDPRAVREVHAVVLQRISGDTCLRCFG